MIRIKLTIPAPLVPIAKLISQAMDPDVGGYAAFEQTENELLYSYTVDVSDEYYAAFLYFREYPALLQQSVALDFSIRFPDVEPPSLTQCIAFAIAVVIEELPALESYYAQ